MKAHQRTSLISLTSEVLLNFTQSCEFYMCGSHNLACTRAGMQAQTHRQTQITC